MMSAKPAPIIQFVIDPGIPLGTEVIGGQHLDRHLTVEPRILGPADDAHPALAELRDDRVPAKKGAGG